MDSHPDSPDSLPGDQLTVDLLNSRAKRRKILIEDVVRRSPDVNNIKNNNNDVDFVIMEDEHRENGDDEVRRFFNGCSFLVHGCAFFLVFHMIMYFL